MIQDDSLESQVQSQNVRDIAIKGDQNSLTFNQTQIIQVSIAEVKTRQLVTTSPYRGLKKFEPGDKDLFFGRDQFLTGLVNELEQSNLILLLGASGSGKSSLIRAGLIPWLTRKWGSKFTPLMFTPDQNPFESLYACLLADYKQSEAQIARVASVDTLRQTVQTLKQPESSWLIFIDQFEELFTTTIADQRDLFISSLVKLVADTAKAKDARLKVVATMRADFLDRLSPYPGLIKASDRHRPMLADMQPDQLRLAIEQPAAHQGVVFEEGLVEEIIEEVEQQAGCLPLLQYTLDLLWQTELHHDSLQDRSLNISTYRQLGGVRGALQQHIEQVYQNLSAGEQLAAQKIFLKLVDIAGDESLGTEWKPIRWRAFKSEFTDPLEQRVLAQLIDQNLLISSAEADQQTAKQTATIEVAHEVLLSAWPTLKDWIRENRQAIALRNRLNSDVARWQAKKSEEELWSGSKLAQVLELSRDPTFNQVLGGFSPASGEFIKASRGRRARQQRVKWAIAAVFLAAGIAFIVQQYWLRVQKEYARAIFLNDQPRLIQALPRFLPDFLAEADRAAQDNKPEVALAYYQRVLALSNQLLTAPAPDQSLKAIQSQAEQSLAKLIQKYRMAELEQLLSQKQPGETRFNTTEYGDPPEQRYTPGALQTTYKILLTPFGAGADLNQDGQLNTRLEANQLPCDTLLIVEKLWKEKINPDCNWSNKFSANCIENRVQNQVDHRTLTASIFDYPNGTEQAVERAEACRSIVQHR